MHRHSKGLAAVALLLASRSLHAQPAPAAPPSDSPAEPAPAPTPAPAPAPAPSPEVPTLPPETPPLPTEPAGEPGLEPSPTEPTEPALPPEAATGDGEPEPIVVPPARDLLGGHFVIGGAGALVAPFARIDDETASNDVLGIGPAFALDLGAGVSRSLLVGVYAQLAFYSSPDACDDCSGTNVAAGAFVRYHLVQGVRFDPWISAGIGYRGLTVENADSDIGYSGIDWLRLQVGGDWYPLAVLGFGPFVELDLGTYFNTRRGTDPSLYVNLLAGLRVVLDFPGK